MSDASSRKGLIVPSLFYGLPEGSPARIAVEALVALEGVGHPLGPWFAADNLITYGHTHGFLTDQRFVAAVVSARPTASERSIAWRTHTLCWAADSVASLAGDFVECGSYRGFSAEVLMHFTAGLPNRHFWLYDLFDPAGGPGEGGRLPDHGPDLANAVRARFLPWHNVIVTQGKVPDVLAQVAPARIALLHVDMNNAEAEQGALQFLFERITPGGLIIFDDYGWSGYQDQKAAADAFMRERSLSVLELPTGQGLVVKR